jgi:hypothetical protein
MFQLQGQCVVHVNMSMQAGTYSGIDALRQKAHPKHFILGQFIYLFFKKLISEK